MVCKLFSRHKKSFFPNFFIFIFTNACKISNFKYKWQILKNLKLTEKFTIKFIFNFVFCRNLTILDALDFVGFSRENSMLW